MFLENNRSEYEDGIKLGTLHLFNDAVCADTGNTGGVSALPFTNKERFMAKLGFKGPHSQHLVPSSGEKTCCKPV